MDSTTAPRRGRRPGARDTRGEIIAAAGQLFADEPFDRVSLRAVARRAGVDPALVHHYFSGKAELFLTAVADVPADPAEVFGVLDELPAQKCGAGLVLAFTAVWDQPGRDGRFTGFVTTMISSPDLTAGAREFITTQIGARVTALADPEERELRATLAVSQMLGMAMLRYTVKVEPIASMERTRLADVYGPTLQHYLVGRLSASELRNSSPASRG